MLRDFLEDCANLNNDIKNNARDRAKLHSLVESIDFDDLLDEFDCLCDERDDLEREVSSLEDELSDVKYEYESEIENKENQLDEVHQLATDLVVVIEGLNAC